MAAKHHRHVALTEPLARFIDQQVTGVCYASASKVVRAALRLLERHAVGARAANDEGDADA